MPFLKKYKFPRTKLQENTTLKNGLRHAIFSSNGDTVYTGEWKNDKKSGKGIEIYKNKWVYEGDWLNGKRHGYGILSYQLENLIRVLKYEGMWENGKPYGFGTQQYDDGSMYEGDWIDGKRSGKGRMWFKDKSFYEGEWLNEKPHGHGLHVYANGNRYEGEWLNGMKYGAGHYYHLDTGQIQNGVWLNDKAVVSQIADSTYRQTAIHPTPYPITKKPKCKTIATIFI
ncbi:uncharacterized protein LOC142326190 isoform X2 [Lycorma delicatula]|uniref:uncharacterized protein LOC142326190 isoform X2 n=1 Tax=Lycorma delicatula TaxID=130591 RepID=UPI003F50E80A